MKHLLNVKARNYWMDSEKPCYIFGPCSAESEEQMRQTASGIARHFPDAIFRAGIWKPRTRPDSFEGMGEKALDWLKMVKQEYGLRTTTEVANPQHLEKCLKAGVDMIWIGARTTANPFSVQAIADALHGIDIPVFVKNPIHPELNLWIGALERLNRAGIDRLGAIHRGFYLYDNGPYRNFPNWNLAVQLKSTLPEIPLLCDVSHISGKRKLIHHVAQRAFDLDMDGLMVETHFDPSRALSDKEQQVTPDALFLLISSLIKKTANASDMGLISKLEEMRKQIDSLDDELLDLLSVRMDLARQIGQFKAHHKMTVLQISRWKETLERCLERAAALGLSDDFVKALLNLIHNESINQQSPLYKKLKEKQPL